MKVPFEWLKEYVTVRLSAEELARRLTMSGLEVASIERVDGEEVLDCEVTPNRPDCLSIIGVAREAAALTGNPIRGGRAAGERRRRKRAVKTPRITRRGFRPTIRISDRKGCPRYIGRLIAGVKVAPSPNWIKRRLTACGVRPINNIVDITNYVLLEYGQPLHAFDFERLTDGMILVRRARQGETITTLDEITRTLSSEMLVIADAKRPVAVAGVMGGTGTEVTEKTQNVLLESALFDPVTIRRTARKLGLSTESSYRFERGVDPVGVETASARAGQLMVALARGTERAVRDVGAKPSRRTIVCLDTNRLNRWLGSRVTASEIRKDLARLSCKVVASGGLTMRVTVPSFRLDIAQEADLYEEVARLIGYDKIPARLHTSITTRSSESGIPHRWLQSLKTYCAGFGLSEVITWALVSEGELARCALNISGAVGLANPLSQDHAYLRPSLLMGMLQAVRRNLTQGALGVRLFEAGTVTRPGQVPVEGQRLGIILSGLWSRDWNNREDSDFFRLKGLVEAVCMQLCGSAIRVSRSELGWAEPGQSAEVKLGENTIGNAGQVARRITHGLDLKEDVWFGELDVLAMWRARRPARPVRSSATLPPVKRDLSIIVGENISFERIAEVIRKAVGALAHRVEFIDRYTGKQVGKNSYSLTFSIEYRDPTRTLTASEVDAIHKRVAQELVVKFGGQLR